VVLVVGGVLGWAIATVVTPATDPLDSTATTFVEVVDGEVGSSINLNTTAEWTPVPIANNQAAGVITSVNVTPGEEVAAGAILYSVNLRPVVIAQGEVPAFRSLSTGTTGADVAQLQSFLAAIGQYQGAVDGRFGSQTARAVKAWQKSIGVAQDGVVQTGDLAFVPTLPTRVSLDNEVISRGAALSGGEDAIRGLPQEPDFVLQVAESQLALIPVGSRVEISAPDGSLWEAVAADHREEATSGYTITLVSAEDGTSICGDLCADIPAESPTSLRSQIVTMETVNGLVVPTAAILTRSDGRLAVTDDGGAQHVVTLVASARGMAVVEGVERGMKVQVPATAG
jgi:peptidoglycan hydrolase-like protein with peptidoglycan-binding domain